MASKIVERLAIVETKLDNIALDISTVKASLLKMNNNHETFRMNTKENLTAINYKTKENASAIFNLSKEIDKLKTVDRASRKWRKIDYTLTTVIAGIVMGVGLFIMKIMG